MIHCTRSKRFIASTAIVAALTFPAVLASCGNDDDGDPREGVVQDDSSEWGTTVDPITGRTFRCVTQSFNHGGGGMAMWCYEDGAP